MGGPVIIDLIGPSVSAEERDLLQHPLVGGIILFTRNFESTTQLSELCRDIRLSRQSPILIAVDQEGGRVQRFKEGFTRLPSMGEVGQFYQHSPDQGLQLAYACGWIMVAELLSVGIDLSLAPILDLNKKKNTVIGDRSFGMDPHLVSTLARELIRGMHEAGMAATGKHFPGHGEVNADSHVALPVDQRSYQEIYRDDLQPFITMMDAKIDALMPAHILFSKVDSHPVGFSRYWLQEILRKQLKFSGVIFSDDLNMAGAECAGNFALRAQMALDAGCDSVLICNNRAGAIEILDQLPHETISRAKTLHRLTGKISNDLKTLQVSQLWKKQFQFIRSIQEIL